jgi:hypothetical protein
MSEFLAAAASTMNVPEALVRRSAEARAKATGASVDDVLQAWAGGAAAPAAPAAPAPSPDPTPAPAGEPVVEESIPVAAEEPVREPAPVAVMVMDEEEDEEPVEPRSLRERARAGGRVGMGYGLLAGLFVVLFSAQWLLARAGSIQSETGDVSFSFALSAGSLLIGSGLLGAVVGAVGAGFVRSVTGWRDPGMRLVSSHVTSIVVGAVAGLFTGVVVGAVVAGAGSVDELDEAVTVVPMLPALFWTLAGWVAGGWLVGALVHAFGVPDGLAHTEAQEGTVVQERLASAFSLPLAAAVGILFVVLPAAWVFIQFPAWAPLIAIFIAGGILAFAGMSAARPGMRISAGEFLVAAAGVGTVVVIVVAVLTTQDAGGH